MDGNRWTGKRCIDVGGGRERTWRSVKAMLLDLIWIGKSCRFENTVRCGVASHYFGCPKII